MSRIVVVLRDGAGHETVSDGKFVCETIPTNIVAGFFGGRFKEKAYFRAQAGAEQAPKVSC